MKKEYLYYILVDGLVIPVDDVVAWSLWYAHTRRAIDQTRVRYDNIDYLISTIFLGIPHGQKEGKPILFETMVFSDNDFSADLYCERCTSYKEALEMHKRAVAHWTKSLKKKR